MLNCNFTCCFVWGASWFTLLWTNQGGFDHRDV